MSNKDFLSQFSDENKPASFKEEERVKITKEHKPVNVKLIVIIVAAILLIAGLILFFVLRPTIEVKNFVGSNVSDVKAWVIQNKIETQGVIFKQEYNFDYDEDIVIYQSVNEGEKIRKDAKLDFTVSLGADPDELVRVPDIESMNKAEIQQWIKSNKLSKTKVTTSYSDDVQIDEVISYEFKNCDADTFTRSSTLNILVSKGPQPAGTATVIDFTNKYFAEVETWGKTNKINIERVDRYSDKVEKDLVISQSIEAKKEIKEGETLTVYVSLGKGILVPNFASMDQKQVDNWIDDNSAYINITKEYSGSSDYVIKQSVKSGSYIDLDNKLDLVINLGNYFYYSDVETYVSNSYDRTRDNLEGLGYLGLNIDVHKNYVESSEPRGSIIKLNKIYNGSSVYSTAQKLPLSVEITYDVSNGEFVFDENEFIGKPVSELEKWIKSNASYEITISPEVEDKTTIITSLTYSTSPRIEDDVTYLPYGVTIGIN